MRNRFKAPIVAAAVASGALLGGLGLAGVAGASAADGVSTGTSGYPGISMTAWAQGSNGGYNGYLGEIRSHATCHYGPLGLLTYTVTGPWVNIRGGFSRSSVCASGAVTDVHYDRRGV